MMRLIFGVVSMLLCLVVVSQRSYAAEVSAITIGSKNFNESYILSEVAAQLLESEGFEVTRKFGLGGTLICYDALRNAEIDLYVEYTGTLGTAILKLAGDFDRERLNAELEPAGIVMSTPLGFNNTYAIVVREAMAEQLGLSRIGDLVGQDLRLVFSHEFLEREDGWPLLSRAYGLQAQASGIEHGLSYQAMNESAIDVTDAYSTDGELVRYGLRVLDDDLGFFPSYFAAPLIRQDLPEKAKMALRRLGNQIDDATMQAMNAAVVFEGQTAAQVAARFLAERKLGGEFEVDTTDSGLWQELVKHTLRHLQLTFVALGLAIVVGVGVSLLVYRKPRLSSAIIYACGLMQTIPSIALLALMIPLFGIGVLPAIIALFLYSLLPILRNAVTALTNQDPVLMRVAESLGLSEREQLKFVRVPLSLASIFAGIKTAAVISIGTATLAAFIGAGGLGEPIVKGLALNSPELILQGAIPAAVLALLTEFAFAALEARMTRRIGAVQT